MKAQVAAYPSSAVVPVRAVRLARVLMCGRLEVGVPELSLYDHQWHAFVRELDGVRMAELRRRKPATDACQFGGAAQLLARGR